MFDEYTLLKDRSFGEYFGFTEDEVKELCEKNTCLGFEALESWYNGYMTPLGIKVYNPRFVVKAIQNNHCESYWTNTGAMIILGFLSYYDGYLKIPCTSVVSLEFINGC